MCSLVHFKMTRKYNLDNLVSRPPSSPPQVPLVPESRFQVPVPMIRASGYNRYKPLQGDSRFRFHRLAWNPAMG